MSRNNNSEGYVHTFPNWIRTRITTYSNSPQRPNKSITIQNFKNSNRSNPQHTKKRPNLDQKTLAKINNHEKNQQKRRKEKRRQLSKTPSFFFLSSSFVFISPHHLHKNKKKVPSFFFPPFLLVFLMIVYFG